VGLVPALNPLCLTESLHGPESARADLFDRGTMGIVAPSGTPEAALNLAVDFSRLLGAQPLFLELPEVDGMMAATHLLPHLAAVGLLNATAGQPGWTEARRLAGRPYALTTASMLEDGTSLALAARYNRENTLHALEMLIGGLTGLYNALKESNAKDFDWRVERAVDDHLAWWNERQKADWGSANADSAPMTGVPGMMDRMLGMFTPKKDKK
jgi:prephenate dehydrogenase